MQQIYAWLSFLLGLGVTTWLMVFLGNYIAWFLGAIMLAGTVIVYTNLKQRGESRPSQEESETRTTAPDTPEPHVLETSSAEHPQKGKVTTMTSFINDQAGDKAHPFLFWVIAIALGVVYIGLARVLFYSWVPMNPLNVPNFGTFTAEDVVPATAAAVFFKQWSLKRARPAGWWYGFVDFAISVVPAALVAIALLSWLGILDTEAFRVPSATKSHLAFITAFYFALGALCDFLFNTWKEHGTVRYSSAVNLDAASAATVFGPAMAVYANGYAVMPLRDDMELTYVPKRTLKVVSAA